MQFCESFFENAHPEALLLDFSEQRLRVAVICWQEVIDSYGNWHAQNIEFDVEEACAIIVLVFGTESSFDTAWDFGDRRRSCHEPAVADRALHDVVDCGFSIKSV